MTPLISFIDCLPHQVRSGLDVSFMLLTCGGVVIKMMTQGPLTFLKQPWYMLDLACLLLALMTLMTSLRTSLRTSLDCVVLQVHARFGLLAVGLLQPAEEHRGDHL